MERDDAVEAVESWLDGPPKVRVLLLPAGNDTAADVVSGRLDGIAREQADAVLPLVSTRLTSWDPATQDRVLLAPTSSFVRAAGVRDGRSPHG